MVFARLACMRLGGKFGAARPFIGLVNPDVAIINFNSETLARLVTSLASLSPLDALVASLSGATRQMHLL
jgi:hypothetical protein